MTRLATNAPGKGDPSRRLAARVTAQTRDPIAIGPEGRARLSVGTAFPCVKSGLVATRARFAAEPIAGRRRQRNDACSQPGNQQKRHRD